MKIRCCSFLFHSNIGAERTADNFISLLSLHGTVIAIREKEIRKRILNLSESPLVPVTQRARAVYIMSLSQSVRYNLRT